MRTYENYPEGQRMGLLWASSPVPVLTGSTLTHRGIGLGWGSSLNTARLASPGSFWAIEMPMRKQPNERVSSIIVHGRTTQSSLVAASGWGVKLYLYGIPGWKAGAFPNRERDWFGPLAVKTLASSPYTLTKKTLPVPSTSASSVWYCAPSVQFDTQDMAWVAILPEIGSTCAGFAAKSGIKLDIDVQLATSG